MKSAKKTILIIEDSQVQALATQLLLENQGANVLRAANGLAGLKMACQTLPDVILLDFEMPGINGFEVCRLLRAETCTAEIPIILCTTHPDQEAFRQSLAGGVINFIPKDVFYTAVLLGTLREMKIIASE